MRLLCLLSILLSSSDAFIAPRCRSRNFMTLHESIEWLDSIRSDEDPNRIDPSKVPPDYNFYVNDISEIDLSAYWYKPDENGWIPPPGFEEHNRKIYGVNPMLDDDGNTKREYMPGPVPPEKMGPKPPPGGRLETLHFTINPDGTFTCQVKGIKGPDCLKLTEEIENVLGGAISMTLTDEFYEDPIVAEAYVETTEGADSGDSSYSGDSWSTAW